MRIRLALLALTVGLSACGSSKPDYERWSLPGFIFSDNPAFGTIFVTGTLKGRNVGYPMNTWNISCNREQMTCRTADVAEIGKRQLGEIWVWDWTVTSWTETMVVLDQDDKTSCAHNLITLNRVAKSATYTSTPQNQDKEYCKGYNKFVGPPSNDKWEIGEPVQPWQQAE
jgi:hypothetical protein